jgi:DNA polymerase-3 subunit beta
LELGITCWIGAQIQEEGSITIPARLLADLVGTLSNDTIELTANMTNYTLAVRCRSSSAEIKGIDAQEFPPMPATDMSEGIRIKVADFKEMIQQVAFAASTEEARPVLQGVQTTVSGDEMVMASTDGFRISVRKVKLEEPSRKPVSMIIPARALNELGRIASDGEKVVKMILPAGRGQVVFRMDSIELVSQLIEGNFPDYKVIIPRSFKSHTIISTDAFLKACRQAEIIARNGNNVVRLSLQSNADRPGQVDVSAQSEETGSNETVIDATIDGPGMVVAFNVRYLREVLEVIKTPNLVLETNDHKSPARVQPVGDESFQHVIMPMFLG